MVYPFAIHLNLFNYCFLHNSFCQFWPPVEVKLCSCPVLFFILFLISLIVVYSCKLEGCIGCKWQVLVEAVYRLDLSEKRKGSTLCRTQLAPLDPPQNTAEHISKDSYIFVKTYLRQGEKKLEKVKNNWGNSRENEGLKRSEEALHGRVTTHLKGPCSWSMKSVRNKQICCLTGGTDCNLWWQQGRTRSA